MAPARVSQNTRASSRSIKGYPKALLVSKSLGGKFFWVSGERGDTVSLHKASAR